MKIVIINGSARKGNTLTAINAFIKGASEKNEIEIIEPDKLNIAPCKGCGVCQCSKGCVDKDDTNPTIDKIAAADMILFATPVYWWGMSAQLKLIIDKCYCRGLQLKNKKVGTIVVGGSPVGSIQYELIDKQFDCMAKYLSWDMLFKKSYYATARDELEKNKDSMNVLEGIGKNYKARSKFQFGELVFEKLGVCLDEKWIVYSGTSVRSGRCFLLALVVHEIMSIHF